MAALPGRAWWIVFPLFTLLVGRLTFERACGDPYRLLLALTSRPATAWPIALLYVIAHLWFLFVYVQVVSRTHAVWPTLADMRGLRRTDLIKMLLMTIVLALEYFPVSLSRIIGATLCDIGGTP